MCERQTGLKSPSRRSGDSDAFVEALFTWLSVSGQSEYDPNVTQVEHAMQSAALASAEGGDSTVIVAALLHDVGHLLLNEHQSRPNFLRRDLKHESVGARWLRSRFHPAVSTIVEHHVDAKRYLCTVDRTYWASLSDASKLSFSLQGGPMSDEEVNRFVGRWWTESAIQLRRIDDRAKKPGLVTPPLTTWRNQLLSTLLP